MKLNAKDFWLAGLAMFVVVVFFPVLRGEFLYWDDDGLFVQNPYFRGLSPIHLQWMCTTFWYGHWQPLSWLSCALDYTAWGMNAAGWHLTNLLLHSVNTVLVYLLCLAGIKEARGRYGFAMLAALFWAVHPLRVEPVAWLATRGYLLCTTFCLLTVLSYIKEVSRRKYPLIALLCFALATFTKGIGMMLPLVLLLIDWFPLRRITSIRTSFRCAIEKTPFFMLSMVTGALAFLAKKAQGGMAPVDIYGPVKRFGQAIYGIWFYLSKTLFPVGLSPLYYKRPEPGFIMVSLLLTAVTVIFLFLFRRKLRPVVIALGSFVLLIFPMLGFTQSGAQLFADRFTYLAAVPFSVLLAVGLARLTGVRRLVGCALAATLLFFSIQTFSFSGVWGNSLSLWHYAVVQDENNVQAHTGMGKALVSLKVYDEALKCFDRALAVDPNCAAARLNRALLENETGAYEKALADVNQALAAQRLILGDKIRMLISRGQIEENLGLDEQALADYSAVIDDQGSDPFCRLMALQVRARLYLETGCLAEGRADLAATLELPDPDGGYQCKAKRILTELKKIPEE